MQKGLVKKSKKKAWLWGVAALGAGLVIYKASKLMKWYDALGVSFTGRISGYRSGNFVIKCRATLDNPKSMSVTISKPTVRIYSGTNLIAKSNPSAEKIVIAPNSLTYIDYEIEVPALSGELFKIFTQAGIAVANLISNLISGNGASISLGIEMNVKYFMKIYGMEREWNEKFTL